MFGVPYELRPMRGWWRYLATVPSFSGGRSRLVPDLFLASFVRTTNPYTLPDLSTNCVLRSLMQHYQTYSTWSETELQVGWASVARAYSCVGDTHRVVSPQRVWDSMVPSSSPGYPWTSMRVSKQNLLESGHTPDSLVAFQRMLYANSTGLCSVFKFFLKDELMKREKMALKGVRIICGAPVTHTLVSGCLTQSLNGAMREHRRECSIQVGINPFSREWDGLAKRMLRFPNHWYADFSGFEFTRCPAEDKHLVLFRGAKLEPGYEEELRRVYRDGTYCNAIDSFGRVFQCLGFTKSGKDSTLEDNSLICERYLRTAWHYLVPSVLRIEDNAELVVFGDDSLLSVSDNAAEHFSPSRLRAFFGERGIKLSGPEDFVAFGDVDFLSFRFGWNALYGVYVPIPDRVEKWELSYTVYAKDMTVVDRLIRIIQLQQLCVFHDSLWALGSEILRAFIQHYSPADPDPSWRRALHMRRERVDLMKRMLDPEPGAKGMVVSHSGLYEGSPSWGGAFVLTE